MLSFHDIVV